MQGWQDRQQSHQRLEPELHTPIFTALSVGLPKRCESFGGPAKIVSLIINGRADDAIFQLNFPPGTEINESRQRNARRKKP